MVNLLRDGNSDTSHVTTEQCCQYTISLDIKKRAKKRKRKKMQSLIKNHMRHECSEAARERSVITIKCSVWQTGEGCGGYRVNP